MSLCLDSLHEHLAQLFQAEDFKGFNLTAKRVLGNAPQAM